MNKLVRNLLDLNELEFGADNNTIEDFDIAELINNCITTYDMVMKQNGIKLEYEPLEPVYVSSDELKVEQVFNNYFTNALNHVDFDKIIRVRIEKEKHKKELYCKPETVPLCTKICRTNSQYYKQTIFYK